MGTPIGLAKLLVLVQSKVIVLHCLAGGWQLVSAGATQQSRKTATHSSAFMYSPLEPKIIPRL